MSNDMTVTEESARADDVSAITTPAESAATTTSPAAPTDAPPDDPDAGGPAPGGRPFDYGKLGRAVLAPLIGITAFLLLWAALAPQVNTSLGTLPGPVDVWDAGVGLYDDYQAERAAEDQFYADQAARNEALIAEGRADEVTDFTYAGTPTFLDQIWTSLRTVGLGFFIG
ncbi:MAG: hypothetical protein AAF945_16490, partial [Actinomycetota bacterium]